MLRRTFCNATLAAAVAATLPGCGSKSKTDLGGLISAISSSGEELSIESAAVSELAGSLEGRVLLQGDTGYAAAKKIWNGMFDSRRPAMVVQCLSTGDVVTPSISGANVTCFCPSSAVATASRANQHRMAA